MAADNTNVAGVAEDTRLDFGGEVDVSGLRGLTFHGPQAGGSFLLDEAAGILTIEGEWVWPLPF